jgi:S1-C subfamily serine protease
MVRQLGEAKKVKAKIEHISHELDLALISADSSFFRDIAPLKLNATEPFLSDVVFVVGYPEGGDTISVTKGIVSRIEAGPYTETLDMLQIQIDAAINGGNSGGPVFGRGNAMIGIAFASLEQAENVGYIIPCRILNHFLESIRRFGVFKGVCRLGLAFQFMENAALAEFKKMGDRSGVLVTQVDPCSPCHGVMVSGDVLLKIDGAEIADDGTVRWRKHERCNMEFVIQSRFPGDESKIEFLREGKVETGRLTLKHLQPLVLDTFAAPATYVFYGGLVLVPFSTPFLDTYEDAPEELTVLLKTARRTHPDEEIVVLSSVVADDITMGYEEFEGEVLKSICGTKVLNLRHAHSLLTSPNLPEMVQLIFGDNICIFKKSEVAAASRKIMRRHKIPKDTNLDEKEEEN